MRTTLAILAALIAAPALAEQAPEQGPAVRPALSGGAEMIAGLDYQDGEFGTGQDIATLSTYGGIRLSSGRFRFAATLPYLRIDAPGNVVGGGGGLLGLPILVDPTQPATRERREGVGDLRVAAGYAVPISAFDLTLSGEVKLPTASARKGLGTGKTDYAVAAEVSKTIGSVTPFVTVGYTLPGDPDGFELRDSLSAQAGAAVRLGSRVQGQLSYRYARSLSPLVPDAQQIATGLNAGLSDRLSLGLWGSAGLTEGAPAVGAGLQLGVRIR